MYCIQNAAEISSLSLETLFLLPNVLTINEVVCLFWEHSIGSAWGTIDLSPW